MRHLTRRHPSLAWQASLVLLGVLAVGCSEAPITANVTELSVVATHSPILATSDDPFTVEATVTTNAASYLVIIHVDGAPRELCDSTPTCSVTVPALDATAPGSAVVGRTIDYEAIVVPYRFDACAFDPCHVSDLNATAITGPDYQFPEPVIPVLVQEDPNDAIDLVFHQADDYGSASSLLSAFIDDVEDKLHDVYLQRPLIAENFGLMNFYVYDRIGDETGCGTPDSQIATDAPFRDADAVLHLLDFQDCAIGTRFSAEGFPTKAFLHESGHAIFGLGDEYDGPTAYFESAVEPNTWANESDCRAEQIAKGRSPGACTQFTARSGGWWKSHAGTTVMVRGNLVDPWGVEGEERVQWVFDQQ